MSGLRRDRTGQTRTAPAIAGLFMAKQSLGAPIYVGAAMKIFYDLALWRAFRRLKPPEERESVRLTN